MVLGKPFYPTYLLYAIVLSLSVFSNDGDKVMIPFILSCIYVTKDTNIYECM